MAMALKLCPNDVQFMPHAAIETGSKGAVAMQFGQLARRDARSLVKPVNILRDNAWHFPASDHPCQRVVAPPRPRPGIKIIHRKLAPPALRPQIRITQEISEPNRLVGKPGRAGGAEIRHTAFG